MTHRDADRFAIYDKEAASRFLASLKERIREADAEDCRSAELAAKAAKQPQRLVAAVRISAAKAASKHLKWVLEEMTDLFGIAISPAGDRR